MVLGARVIGTSVDDGRKSLGGAKLVLFVVALRAYGYGAVGILRDPLAIMTGLSRLPVSDT